VKLSDFFYDLPEDRIAQEPITPRDQSRLCVVHPDERIEHRRFTDLIDYLQPGDLLVTNQTKVFPARLRGQKETGGKVEILLLSPLGARQWRSLVRGATSPVSLRFPDGLEAVMSDRNTQGEWVLTFNSEGLIDYLQQHGEMPLPPYIRRPKRREDDTDRYQTVFARDTGAVAAPTAGFHFTHDLLDRLVRKGVQAAQITLHVGWGTFRPVRSERIEEHVMLPERYSVAPEAAEALNAARATGKRIVAVGTTSVRTLETIVDESGHFRPGEGESNLFIYPGYVFKAVDVLVTNFHLPDSTPLLLANAFHRHRGAFKSAPFTLREAYRSAIEQGYRFYSYGDAMVIL